MKTAPLLGPKLRDRRRALGITQSALSATLGISPSYLNLIEAGKRNIGGGLLKRIAEALGLSVDELDGAAERRLLGDLAELAAEPLLAALRLDPAVAADLAGRHPGWARALVALHRAWLERGRAVGALTDRLHQDPFLAETVHDLLTRATAIRSSAEILESAQAQVPDPHRRFVTIVGDESRRLAEVARALAGFFAPSRAGTRPGTPAAEVEDFLLDRGNHFPALEEAAGAIGTPALGAPRHAAARAAVEAAFPDGPLADEVRASPLLTSDAARRRARRALASYLAAAVLMPYAPFLDAARRARYDVDALARRFEASPEQVCHRLVTLRRPGAEGLPFGLMRVDAAGFTSRRYPLPRLPLPRHGGACPLWAVYQALQSPGAIVRQLVEFPDGARFLFVARALDRRGAAFPMPRRLVSLMLACDALVADQTVYGDGLDLASAAPAVPVGSSCRACVRAACAYRQEDAVDRRLRRAVPAAAKPLHWPVDGGGPRRADVTRVLIAEDDPNIVESLSFVLSRAGFEVSAALDGDEALRRLRSAPPDVMILDLMLPKRNGFEVLKSVKTDPALRALPVIVLTAKGQPQDRQLVEQIGVEGFMTKPFSNTDVVEAVRRLGRR